MNRLVMLLLVVVFITLSVRAEAPTAVVWSTSEHVFASFEIPVFAMEPVAWNQNTGFQITEPSFAVGWLTYVYADRFQYARVVQGRNSGDFYLIFADSLDEFVAGYGGAHAWHSIGAFRVQEKDFPWELR